MFQKSSSERGSFVHVMFELGQPVEYSVMSSLPVGVVTDSSLGT